MTFMYIHMYKTDSTDGAILNVSPFHGGGGGGVQGPWLVSGWKEIPHNDLMYMGLNKGTLPLNVFYLTYWFM